MSTTEPDSGEDVCYEFCRCVSCRLGRIEKALHELRGSPEPLSFKSHVV